MPYVRNNAQFLSFTALLTLVNVGLIVGRLYEYSGFKNSDGSVNWCIMIARAAGQWYSDEIPTLYVRGILCSMFLASLLIIVLTECLNLGLNYMYLGHMFNRSLISRLCPRAP